MADRTDILLTEDNDLMIYEGDFVTGVSDQQHVMHILQSVSGDYKQYPVIGVNMINFINGFTSDMARTIKLQLMSDGYNVKNLIVDNGNISVEI